jgi:hypothetical protein
MLIPRPRSPTVCIKKGYEIEEEASAHQRAVKPLLNAMNERGDWEIVNI